MTHLFSLYPIREIPEDLMNYTVGNLTQTYQEYARMYGMDFASFLRTYLQQDETTFDAQVKKAADQTLKEELLLKAIAEKENIRFQMKSTRRAVRTMRSGMAMNPRMRSGRHLTSPRSGSVF